MQGVIGVLLLCVVWFAVNGIYQVLRKPTELFFPVSGTLNKTPLQTWRQYQSIFRSNATDIIPAELLAALAQVEGSGNPVARTYWRWSLTYRPLQIYRPASSAVGMYQITDSTFAQARQLCIHHHKVVMQGAWNDWHSCWFNRLYSRIIPAHAAELTAAYLDRSVSEILTRHRVAHPGVERQQALAAIIHLCGAGAGDEYVRRGFNLAVDQRCGDQQARTYVARVTTMRTVFERLAIVQNGQR